MANNFYIKSGNPTTGSAGSSSIIRNEFELVEQGFDKLPPLNGNGGKLVRVNAPENALEVVINAASNIPNVPAGGVSATNVQAAINELDSEKAPLNSPALTGTPTASTAAVDTTSTQLATTAFVVGQAASTTSPMDGVAAVGTSKRYARQDHVHPSDTAKLDVATYTASDILAKLKTVDGVGSGLDAELLGGQPGSYYMSGASGAAQADMEAATRNDVIVTPANAHWHPTAAKVWGKVSVSGGTPAIDDSFGVSSIIDGPSGRLTVNFATAFSSVHYSVVASFNGNQIIRVLNPTTTKVELEARIITALPSSYSTEDPGFWCFAAFGDQ